MTLSDAAANRIAIVLAALVVLVSVWPVFAFDIRHYLPEVDNDEMMSLPSLRGKYALARKMQSTATQKCDWHAAFSASPDWQSVAHAGDYTLFRSTVQCRPTAPDRHPG